MTRVQSVSSGATSINSVNSGVGPHSMYFEVMSTDKCTLGKCNICLDSFNHSSTTVVILFTADCEAGEFVDPSDTSQCLPCPRGTYTNRNWQESCESCSAEQTTLGEGADSPTDCISE